MQAVNERTVLRSGPESGTGAPQLLQQQPLSSWCGVGRIMAPPREGGPLSPWKLIPVQVWLRFSSHSWLDACAGNPEIRERWQVLKEDISTNKLTLFIANWKNSSYFYFSLSVA